MSPRRSLLFIGSGTGSMTTWMETSVISTATEMGPSIGTESHWSAMSRSASTVSRGVNVTARPRTTWARGRCLARGVHSRVRSTIGQLLPAFQTLGGVEHPETLWDRGETLAVVGVVLAA